MLLFLIAKYFSNFFSFFFEFVWFRQKKRARYERARLKKYTIYEKNYPSFIN